MRNILTISMQGSPRRKIYKLETPITSFWNFLLRTSCETLQTSLQNEMIGLFLLQPTFPLNPAHKKTLNSFPDNSKCCSTIKVLSNGLFGILSKSASTPSIAPNLNITTTPIVSVTSSDTSCMTVWDMSVLAAKTTAAVLRTNVQDQFVQSTALLWWPTSQNLQKVNNLIQRLPLLLEWRKNALSLPKNPLLHKMILILKLHS